MLMSNKKGVIMGLTNEHSIAWSIAKRLKNEGAELIFTYPNDRLATRMKPLVESLGCKIMLQCDVLDEASITTTFQRIGEEFGKLDFLVHSIAFSDKSELKGRYINTTKDNFLTTMHVSCFSFTEICKFAEPLMSDGGSIITLSYYGAEKVMPNYNVMGVAKAALECSVRYLSEDLGRSRVRVNAISAGPIKTLAASGIGDFSHILSFNSKHSPLRRTVSQEEVAGSALYLLSDLSSGVTGEIHYVDAGYNVIGMPGIKHNTEQ